MIFYQNKFQYAIAVYPLFISECISPFSGNLLRDFFENINSPFKHTSNTPPPLDISATSIPGKFWSNSASKLEACGR